MAKSKQSHLNTQYLTAPFSIEGAKTILFRDSNLFRSGNLAKQILGPMLSPLLPSRHPRGVRWLLRCQSCCYAAVLLPSIPSTQRTITTAASMRLLALFGWLLSPSHQRMFSQYLLDQTRFGTPRFRVARVAPVPWSFVTPALINDAAGCKLSRCRQICITSRDGKEHQPPTRKQFTSTVYIGQKCPNIRTRCLNIRTECPRKVGGGWYDCFGQKLVWLSLNQRWLDSDIKDNLLSGIDWKHNSKDNN